MGNLIRTFSLAEHEACMAGEVAEPSVFSTKSHPSKHWILGMGDVIAMQSNTDYHLQQ